MSKSHFLMIDCEESDDMKGIISRYEPLARLVLLVRMCLNYVSKPCGSA